MSYLETTYATHHKLDKDSNVFLRLNTMADVDDSYINVYSLGQKPQACEL